MKKIKSFDAVKMMRDIREKMNKQYLEDNAAFKKELKSINEKYKIVKQPLKFKGRHKLSDKI